MTPSDDDLRKWFARLTTFKANRFHPLVWISGDPEIGEGTFIGAMSEVNAKDARVVIGRDCDIASFVAINCDDSHNRCIGLSGEIERRAIGGHRRLRARVDEARLRERCRHEGRPGSIPRIGLWLNIGPAHVHRLEHEAPDLGLIEGKIGRTTV